MKKFLFFLLLISFLSWGQVSFALANISVPLTSQSKTYLNSVSKPNYKALGIKYFGLSYHPQKPYNSHLMPLKLDKDASFVINLGASFNFEYFFLKDIFSVKGVQAFYSDCAQQFAGFSHIGFRGQIFKWGNLSLNGGIGPTFIYRKNWYNLDGYDNKFSFFYGGKNDVWQTRFLWYGGEFEFNYEIFDKTELSFAIIPGGIDLINLSVGFRYKFL